MQYILTNNAAALEPGQAQYTIIPNEIGGAVDDAYLYRLSEEEYLLVVNAANAEKDWIWLQDHKSQFSELVLEDHTSSLAMLSLQGPETKAVLELIIGGKNNLPEPTRNRLTTVQILGAKVPIARTGYTGEPICFELFPPSRIAESLFESLLTAGKTRGIVPVGLGARDTLRLEAGLPLYGHELGIDDEGHEIPLFALPTARFAISFSKGKGEFIGRKALIEQFQEIKLRQMILLDTSKQTLLVPKVIKAISVIGGIARAGYPVYMDENLIGNITSGTVAPYWRNDHTGIMAKPGDKSDNRSIGLAYIDADLQEGQKINVLIRGKVAQGIIVPRHIGGEAAPYARPILNDEPESSPLPSKHSIQELARNLVSRTNKNTVWRQKNTINLIPSEQTMSPIVKMLTIADPSGRYAEHKKVKALGDCEVYYYQGTDFISNIEIELKQSMQDYLGCSQVEVRPLSGQMANTAVFSALLDYFNEPDKRSEPRRLKSVINPHIGRGGHLSAQPMGALRNYISIDPVTERWAVVNFPVLTQNPYQIDIAKTADLIEKNRPELIILGKSMTLHREPVEQISRIVTSMTPKPLIMYDAAHVLGLLSSYFQKPLDEGADIITASTHKTFFGTQRGIIASNMNKESKYFELWERIERRVFPGSVSNHHLGSLLGLLMATYEMNTYGSEYQKQIIANAKALASACAERGLHVEGDPKVNYTETHQVILRVGYARGIEIADRLERGNIIVNYQALPDDEAFTASSGLRLGVQEMTRFGMKEDDFKQLSEYIAAAIIDNKDISQSVSTFRKRFAQMHYCLPEQQARPLINELIGSLVN
jgi:aminomethyltransferase